MQTAINAFLVIVLVIVIAVIAAVIIMTVVLRSRRRALVGSPMVHPSGTTFIAVGIAELWAQLDLVMDPPEPAPASTPGERYSIEVAQTAWSVRRENGELLLDLPTSAISAIDEVAGAIRFTFTAAAGLNGTVDVTPLGYVDLAALRNYVRA